MSVGGEFDSPFDAPFGPSSPALEYPPPLDSEAIGLARLLEQFKPKPRINALAGAFLSVVNDLETATYDLRTKRLLDGEGAQLDVLGGQVFDVARDGRSDAAYVALIQVWEQARGSNGTIPEIYALLERVAPFGAFTIDNQALDPAGMGVDFTSPILSPTPADADDLTAELLEGLLREARGGAIRLAFSWWPAPEEELFEFSEEDDDLEWPDGFSEFDDEDDEAEAAGALSGEVIA